MNKKRKATREKHGAKAARAKALLLKELANGPRRSSELYRLAARSEEPISRSMLRYGKKVLRIGSFIGDDGCSFWEMPDAQGNYPWGNSRERYTCSTYIMKKARLSNGIPDGWYEDGEGDLMPASVDAWDEEFDEADEHYRKRIPGWDDLTEEQQLRAMEKLDDE